MSVYVGLMKEDIYFWIGLASFIITIAGIVRFFSYTAASLKLKRAQTSLLAQIARQQNESKNEWADDEIWKTIQRNEIIDEVPVKRVEGYK